MSTVPPRDEKYEEIDSTLREVVKLFSERDDIKAVLQAGSATAELKSLCDARHKEILQSIRGESRCQG
jgi:chorismate mutase